MKLNLNDTVIVKLTEAGKSHRASKEAFWSGYLGMDMTGSYPKDVYSGYSKWQLWVLMECFGEKMQMGSPSMFEDNEITF